MTIALTIKVNDGLVLAADSATTMTQQTPNGPSVINIYDNANKVFHLHKDIPVGAVTWGLGNIGVSSISTLVKEFRSNLSLDVGNYTLEELSNEFFNFIYREKYLPNGSRGAMGFIIGGYSANSNLPEKWRIFIDNNGYCDGPTLLGDHNWTGTYWDGQPEAIARILKGTSYSLPSILRHAQLEEEKIQEIMELCDSNLIAPLVMPAMPIQDAIDLAEFLVDTTIKYVKYTPGNQTVGGPIEIAVITKYEGLKWIKRKHYYSELLNN